MMIKCPDCGSQFDEKFERCPNCGRKADSKPTQDYNPIQNYDPTDPSNAAKIKRDNLFKKIGEIVLYFFVWIFITIYIFIKVDYKGEITNKIFSKLKYPNLWLGLLALICILFLFVLRWRNRRR